MKHRSSNMLNRSRQRGISLFTVLVLLLLSLTAVLGAFRVANLNEALLGNTADYNRAYAAAEALVRDAEMDIRGRRPPYTTVQSDGTLGFPCRPNPPSSTTSIVTATGFLGCRNQAAPNTPWMPRNIADYDAVSDIVFALSPTRFCSQGICVPPNMATLANIENDLVNMIPLGATYGQFTRNALAAPGVASNPVLAVTATRGAWYWVEVFTFAEATSGQIGGTLNPLVPNPSAPFVYRITAVAQGLKPGTRVVIKSVFIPYPAVQNP